MSLETFIAGRAEPAQVILRALVEEFESYGCRADHKTIYVSFSSGSDVVAAAYPHTDLVEVALALEDDASDPRLFDARHLTWRTLPVLVEVRSANDIANVADLISLAVERVKKAEHDVSLSNDRFRSRERRLFRR